jgi:hypothetical protein
VWEDIGITSFDGPLEALFAAQTVAEANKILTDNGMPPLVQCSTVSYASVHVHLQGARNGSNDADLLRAAELIQIEVDAGRFVVTVLNRTGVEAQRNVSYFASRWDKSTSTALPTTTTTTTTVDPGVTSGGEASSSSFFKNST